MIKKGFAAIYIIILLIPIMMFSFKMIDLAVIDYKISSNIFLKQQALYNAEAGIEFSKKIIKEYSYPKSFNKTYYLGIYDDYVKIFSDRINIESMITISISSQTKDNNVEYIINSMGSYKGYDYNIKKTVKRFIK
ncbi:MAG: hypothetical protein N2448_09220 [Caloramator sp.]|nr:hypothetical protein [Caloramator sp.]